MRDPNWKGRILKTVLLGDSTWTKRCVHYASLYIPAQLIESSQSKDKVEKFKKISSYVQGAYDEDDAFQNLEKELQKMADKDFDGESNRVYYVSRCLIQEDS